MKFRSDTAGFITGVRFYKGSQNTGTHVGSLWTATGTRLAHGDVHRRDGVAAGSRSTSPAPVAIAANTTYVASYHTPVGCYAADDGFFATTGVDAPPLHALADGVDGGNGVYRLRRGRLSRRSPSAPPTTGSTSSSTPRRATRRRPTITAADAGSGRDRRRRLRPGDGHVQRAGAAGDHLDDA